MNQFIFTGTLMTPPEGYVDHLGETRCRFNVALSTYRPAEAMSHITVVASGKQAENCVKYLAIGRTVLVEGYIVTSASGNNGVVTCMARQIEFMGWAKGYRPSTTEPFTRSESMSVKPAVDSGADDIPF